MKYLTRASFTLLLILVVFQNAVFAAESDLMAVARKYKNVHKYSTLFTAQDVKNYLSKEEGLKNAVQWCRKTGVLKVYIESYRDGYQADENTLINARDFFKKEGFEVCGCVTTTKIGKPTTGWGNVISCYTDKESQKRVKSIFEYTAGIFDEIMIDDFWFTDCACSDCDAARKAKIVTIGERQYPVSGDSWEDYRRELMYNLSKDYIINASRKINPKVKIIIKYPQWYDRFHERGYDVVKETELFDKIWVGTETRDYEDKRWGGTVQYEGYFIMRWLGGIGAEKCGGGWYDWLGTTEKTYIEQARQTILAGARESFLFCYGGLQGSTGPRNIEVLRQNIPELLKIASEVRKRKPIGIAAYKPPNSHPEEEPYIFDCVGMLGLPLVPCHKFPVGFPAAFFSVHSLKENGFIDKLTKYIQSGKTVLITDGLAKRINSQVDLSLPNVILLKVNGSPKSLLQLNRQQVTELQTKMLKPFKVSFKSGNKVGFYLYSDGSYLVENFNNEPVEVELNGKILKIDSRGWVYEWK